jgi:maleylpyruvate isomerase
LRLCVSDERALLSIEEEFLKLYGYFRSSAAYPVRIALNLKAIPVDHVAVHLVKEGGHQQKEEYLRINPQAIVPTLKLDDGTCITQSLAIIEYLDSVFPAPKLIPSEPIEAARARAIALAIACEIHPLNNLRVLNFLRAPLGRSAAEVDAWYRHWVLEGLQAVANMLPGDEFCFGDRPTIADCCLVPQLFNARRFSTPIDHLPKILRVESSCAQIDAFAAAHPSRQSDVA